MSDEYDDDDFGRESVYSLAPEDILFQARCMFPFESTCDVELSLNEGDIVNVTRTDVGGGWWEGEHDGNHGLFPETYVQAVDGEGATADEAQQAGEAPAGDEDAAAQQQYDTSAQSSHRPTASAHSSVSAPPGAPFITVRVKSAGVFSAFLEWKTGKRQAEAESSESKFLSSIVRAEALPDNHEETTAQYHQFSQWFEKQLHSLEAEYDALLKVHKATTEGLEKVSKCFKCFGDPTLFAESERPAFKPWWEQDDPMMHLLNSLGIIGEGVKQLSILSSEQEDEDRSGILGFVKEYTSLLKAFHPVFKAHHSAWHEYQQMSAKDNVPAETLASIERNCETISAVVLAEARHFYENAGYDLCMAMREHMTAKAAFHRKAAELWEQLLSDFPQPQ
ncbi:hypothetical protein PTSG_02542 [Salpingoeca rosetta]|uniref:SH3 domain-containing protein n=1 Tax=Salpingoeca rosetta (strain ATCC 50818 / BSB-021) TaxID=946362 RepID=F2U2H6_SALR5|nr:uncharacterized protein PTSG_02542 [Salpingoeca rosetta]EGD81828.1 hypothetical protein PTSG_02542 [Salpingoeca rosetta]|eukprot:XP_004997032.1 hypothetical protein PTSG_02542 [Salpingoeca rosetta]